MQVTPSLELVAASVREQLNAPSPAPLVRRWWTPRRPHRAALVVQVVVAAGTIVMAMVQLVGPTLGRGQAHWTGWVGVAGLVLVLVLCRVGARGGVLAQAASTAGTVWICLCAVQVWTTTLVGTIAAPAAMVVTLVVLASLSPRRIVLVTAVPAALTSCLIVAYQEGWTPMAVLDGVIVVVLLVLVSGVVLYHVEDSERLMARLEGMAAVDSLTGLVTRRVLDDALASSLTSAATEVGTALLLVDVDEFKSINDRFGHPGGDTALQHVAAVLRGTVRSTDAVVSRLGGDEIAILLPGCPVSSLAGRAGALVIAVRDSPVQLGTGEFVTMTISVGAAHAPSHAGDVASLYAAADAALYAAKRGGRDRSVVC